MERADVRVLSALGDQVSVDVLWQLLDEPVPQKEIVRLSGLPASAISKRMARLQDAGLVFRSRSHGPYEIHNPARLRTLLESAAAIGREAAERYAAEATAHDKAIRRAGLAGGHFRDRSKGSA